MSLLEGAIQRYQQYKLNKRRDKHMDGFEELLRDFLPKGYSLKKHKVILEDSRYRKKRWDYTIVRELDNESIGIIELKSLHKSANKNINNRQEEAVGCAEFAQKKIPSVKRSYLLVGVCLEDRAIQMWKDFLDDCLKYEWYHSVCLIIMDEDGNWSTPKGMSVADMMRPYKGFPEEKEQ